ncbi:MAG: response regulator, partial [Candidatus Omnitrophica bacterium]|nr:response regulator [Candidatus Omnitrophota bacterium]
KANPKAKVVMITAVGQDTIIEECKKAGASDYIIKPFDKEKVITTVQKYLG